MVKNQAEPVKHLGQFESAQTLLVEQYSSGAEKLGGSKTSCVHCNLEGWQSTQYFLGHCMPMQKNKPRT